MIKMVEYNIPIPDEEEQIDVDRNEERSKFIPPHSCVDVERVCDLFNGNHRDKMLD